MSLLSERIVTIAMAADFITSRRYSTNAQKFRLWKIFFDDSIVHMQSHDYKKYTLYRLTSWSNFLKKITLKNLLVNKMAKNTEGGKTSGLMTWLRLGNV